MALHPDHGGNRADLLRLHARDRALADYARRGPAFGLGRRSARGHVNILAIDQGTSATKAILVGPGNEPLGAAEVPVAVRAAGPAVETDPERLYESVLE